MIVSRIKSLPKSWQIPFFSTPLLPKHHGVAVALHQGMYAHAPPFLRSVWLTPKPLCLPFAFFLFFSPHHANEAEAGREGRGGGTSPFLAKRQVARLEGPALPVAGRGGVVPCVAAQLIRGQCSLWPAAWQPTG